MIYLYLKTHNKTGKKYLGKTISNPYDYSGSGKIWKHHLKKHGNDVTTKVLFESEDKTEIKKMGIYYSNLWNIVDSSNFCNLIPEQCDGGSMPWSKESRDKLSKTMTGRKCENRKLYSEEEKKKRSSIRKKFLEDPDHYNDLLNQMKEHCHTPEATEKKSKKMSKKKWFNNGDIQIRSESCPGPEWIEGRLGYVLSAVKCPHCGKEGGSSAMKRWHFDNCKLKK
jgi:hypothetical protein